LFERPDFRTSPVADTARMPCARRAGGGRRLSGSGGGQLRALQFKNVFPAVKPAVDDKEGGAAYDCDSRGCKPCR
jgi:hypothetical protein